MTDKQIFDNLDEVTTVIISYGGFHSKTCVSGHKKNPIIQQKVLPP